VGQNRGSPFASAAGARVDAKGELTAGVVKWWHGRGGSHRRRHPRVRQLLEGDLPRHSPGADARGRARGVCVWQAHASFGDAG
jgi:hypothetical protein